MRSSILLLFIALGITGILFWKLNQKEQIEITPEVVENKFETKIMVKESPSQKIIIPKLKKRTKKTELPSGIVEAKTENYTVYGADVTDIVKRSNPIPKYYVKPDSTSSLRFFVQCTEIKNEGPYYVPPKECESLLARKQQAPLETRLYY